METIAQGAEANIIKLNDKILKKLRLSKPYRLKIIDDRLRKFRCKREFKILTKLYENKINVPKPYELIIENDEISFTFEYIKGNILKSVINEKLLKTAFQEIIKMHNQDIVHNDLTTLNMIQKNNKIYIIDFGLSIFSNKIEDKAVDLNLFFTCIKNEHPSIYKNKEALEKLYTKKTELGEKIIKRLKEIEKRGRNK